MAILALICSSLATLSAQTPRLSYEALSPICVFDSTRCNTRVTFPFRVVVQDTVGFQLLYQVAIEGRQPESDVYGLVTGVFPNYEINGNYPLGRHHWIFSISNAAGQDTVISVPFRVVDCQAPSPKIKTTITLQMRHNDGPPDVDGDSIPDKCIATLNVEDLLAHHPRDCRPPVRYSLHRLGESPQLGQTSLILTPFDALVELYAWDSADNPYSEQPDGSRGGPNYAAFPATVVLTNPPQECCCLPPAISGRVATSAGTGVDKVRLILRDGQFSDTTLTSAGGNFRYFRRLQRADAFSVAPWLDEAHGNGVTTLDLLLITKHILGIDPFDTPYKWIAADVNRSGTVTTLDIIQLRRVILGIDSRFAENTSWRFVPANFQFPTQQNPLSVDFPESVHVNFANEASLEKVNFVAVKIGDVNGSANTGGDSS